MSTTVKPCLECTTNNPGDAVTCLACGGGSWPLGVTTLPIAENGPPPTEPEKTPDEVPFGTIQHPELAETAEQPAVEDPSAAPAVDADPGEPPSLDGDDAGVTSQPADDLQPAVETTSGLPKPNIAKKQKGKPTP